jgi:TolB-like protein
MKKYMFLFLTLVTTWSAMAKDTIAILPFTGGEGEDGETLAILFTNVFTGRAELRETFDPIPRTRVALAIQAEQKFQMDSGMTNADTIAAIGHQLGAQYIVSGNITQLGTNKMLVVSILRIDTVQLLGGDIQTFTRIEDLTSRLPDMANVVAASTRLNTSALPKVAVLPFQLAGGISRNDADTLAQIVAVYMARSGKTAIYPRTSSLEQIQREYRHQLSGNVADENIVAIGYGVNPDFVLSGSANKLGAQNLFVATILNLETGVQTDGTSVNYNTLNDGISAMNALAEELTGMAAVKREKNRRLYSIGGAVGSSFAAPWFILGLSGTYSFFDYTCIDAGLDIGFNHGNKDRNDIGYFSLYPFIRFNGLVSFTLGTFSALWYGGAGLGVMAAFYEENGLTHPSGAAALDLSTGFYVGKGHHYLTAAYTIRTTFKAMNTRLAAGYAYRF